MRLPMFTATNVFNTKNEFHDRRVLYSSDESRGSIIPAYEVQLGDRLYECSDEPSGQIRCEEIGVIVWFIANDIRALEHKISILDKIEISSEQECKRKEQQVQELIDKRIE